MQPFNEYAPVDFVFVGYKETSKAVWNEWYRSGYTGQIPAMMYAYVWIVLSNLCFNNTSVQNMHFVMHGSAIILNYATLSQDT